jgi:hypothetical protein
MKALDKKTIEFAKNLMDIHFTDKQGNEFFIEVRAEEVKVWKNKTKINNVRFYVEELTK